MNDLAFLNDLNGKKILIAPLDWGLGHATRSSCIIAKLKSVNEVHIASSGLALTWLRQTFPDLPYHQLPSYDVSYRFDQMWRNILHSAPNILKSIRTENQTVKELNKRHKYDLIIADHRFGAYNKHCRSVVIAHQIQIPHSNPIIASLSSFLNRRLLNKYNEVWVPDYKESEKSLSGRLSNSWKLKNAIHIGPLSMIKEIGGQTQKDIDLSIILSGPEPNRTNLEFKLLELLKFNSSRNVCLVRGSNITPSGNLKKSNIFNKIIDLADHNMVADIMSRSHRIICRSGYSTIMDLEALGRKAILIPTKNQPEQEYLASYHSTRGYRSINEHSINKELLPMLNEVE